MQSGFAALSADSGLARKTHAVRRYADFRNHRLGLISESVGKSVRRPLDQGFARADT